MKFLFIAITLLASLLACDQKPHDRADQITDQSTGVSLHSELGGSATGFERACSPRQFNFPIDHGAHPAFRNEWWYITGNLTNAAGRRFGFHITFFRIANEPTSLKTNTRELNNWSSREFYMAHFAVTAEDGEIKTYERFSRAAAGLAGAAADLARAATDETSVVKIWLDDWQLRAQQEDDQLVWHLNLSEQDLQLDLRLTSDKPLVLQGDAGYSQKSADACNASYYYSFTRLSASGDLSIKSEDRPESYREDGREGNWQDHKVSGSAWFDREWSSSALGDNQSGWDWFALQLDDGRDIMLYQLRKKDGSRDTYSHAVEIDRHGIATEIPIENIELEITRWWQSETGSRYPVAGVIHRRDTSDTIVFNPLVDDQLLDLTVRYWEGAIHLTDTDQKPIGRGYMELTGY